MIILHHNVNIVVVMIFFLVMTVTIVCPEVNAQMIPSEKMDDHILNIYDRIKMISDGPSEYFIDTPFDDPNARGEVSAHYRYVVTRFEIYNSLFLERIGEGEEGLTKNITEIYKVDIDSIIANAENTEGIYIESIEWLDTVTAKIIINDTPYILKADKYIPIQ